jgi:putative DNA primase/helicase
MACVILGMGAMPPDGPVWGADPEVAKEVQQLRRLNTDAEFSEDGLALEFSARHADTLRYVAMWGSWLHWNCQQWQRERTLKVYDEARTVCREAVDRGGDAKRLLSAKTVAAIETLARSDRRHATTADVWDADAWVLNTLGGIVDLRTGNLLPHDAGRHITKITAVAPGGDCPRWRLFLDEISAGDRELQDFLQRVIGYALTGSTSEHALFFAYGTGANGKGVFLNTVAAILADYAKTAPMETFTATQGDRHPTELAGLMGARLVTAQETEQGRRWAESKIKSMTGGDPISARFMRQDFFEFVPQFKLLIAGNHKPGLRGVDEAIRRRLHLIPFTVTIPPEKRDKDLAEKLRDEWGGILQWMIDGCLEWQRDGLNPPAIVREATAAYLAAEDALAQWLDECCACDAAYAERSGALFASWKALADAAGEYAGSQKRFSQSLEDRGFARDRGGEGERLFRGLTLRP